MKNTPLKYPKYNFKKIYKKTMALGMLHWKKRRKKQTYFGTFPRGGGPNPK